SELELRPGARLDAELLEMLPSQVQLHVPEPVDVEAAGANPSFGDVGLRHVELYQRARLDRWAELLDRHPLSKMRGCRRENIAAVERRRDGLERVIAIRHLVGGVDPSELLRSRDQEPVVGPDEETPVS